MSKNILFISEQKLKDSSFLSDNIDPKQLLPTVKAVQDRYLHPLLGTALYEKLQALITQPPVPAGEYKTLLDEYLTDVVVWYTLGEMPMPLYYKLLNKGVVLRTGEAIQTTSFQDVQNMMNYCRDYAKYYAQRAIEYLCANAVKFPEYTNPGSAADTLQPDNTQYDCGIYLGNQWPDSRSFEEKYQGNRYRKP